MKDHLKDRISRSLEGLSDEQGYRVLDFVEFLQSKYASRSTPDNLFTKLTDRVEDTLRAGKLPLDAISGTVNLMGGASKVMKGLASAAQAVVEETSRTTQELITPKPAPAPKAPAPAAPAEGESH